MRRREEEDLHVCRRREMEREEEEDQSSNMDEQVSKMRTIIFKQYVTPGVEIMERLFEDHFS